MSDTQSNIVIRFAVIVGLIVLGFAAVLGKIIYIQTVEREALWAIAEQQVAVIQPIRATRGNILDCNGSLLASSMPQYYVYMDTKAESLRQHEGELFRTHIDSLAIGFSRIVGDRSAAEYKQLMTQAYRQGKRRVRLCKGRINYLQLREIEQLPLVRLGRIKSGVYFEAQHNRIKPFGNLASRTIGGLYGDEGIGNSGLEKQFDKELRGKDGLSSRQRIGGRYENVTIQEAEDGVDIVTTIDANLQDMVEKTLRARLEKYNADWGCCILMETHTGEIRAISNLDRTEAGTYREQQNHAVMRVEPGSTFKTIALMAALEDGKVDIDDTISVHKGGWQYFNARHTDAHPRDTVYTVRSALAASSNIALAKIITHAYEGSAKKFVRRMDRMGLLDSVYCEIPGANLAHIVVPKDTVTLSRMSYGYSVELTPMQVLMFYNAIANDGKMVRPMLVKEIRREGDVMQSFDTEVVTSSICSGSTLRDIRGALHDVVWDDALGTASVNPWRQRKAQSDIVHIAGKTGTAQLLVDGRYTGRRHRISFVGYFPEENPQYTCICVINDPRGYYDAGMDCGNVVRIVAEKTMAYTGCYMLDDGQLILEKNKR